MTISWRGFFILPLLFLAVNCQDAFDESVHPVDGLSLGEDDHGGDSPSGLNLSNNGLSKDGDQGNDDAPRKVSDGGGDSPSVEFYKEAEQGGAESTVSDSGGKKSGENKANGVNGVVQTTQYKGLWEIFSQNSGVSAMHLILLPKINQVLMFDATVWKISKLKLPGPPCRHVEGTNEEDCWCHSILMDIETAQIRPLRLKYDTWCSSGALDVNGRLVSTGGYNNGSDTVRILDICPTCEWEELPGSLGNGRWYATQVTLSDGRFMVFGGRNFPTYEFVPPEGQKNTKNQVIDFKFLAETHDPVENNLYPFVYLSTDGNLFVFANNRSILLNPNTQKIVHEFPVLPGGARNYPSSAASCLLPIMLQPDDKRKVIQAEVLICGGAPHEAFTLADLTRPKVFLEANKDCARLDITKRNGKWKIVNMPSPRLMGDAVVLPTGDVLLINGAMKGSAGWDDARDPNFTPVLYHVRGGNHAGAKFTELKASQIPRMYHSTAALLPDGSILVAGSNTNPGYLDQALFPTEVRVEKFYPHYFDKNLEVYKVDIKEGGTPKQIKYGEKFSVQIQSNGDDEMTPENLQVSIYYPAFTTHGISMNQRLVQLATYEVKNAGNNIYDIETQAPPNGNVAPPGYYMLFVNYKRVPCRAAVWVQLLP